MNLLVKRYFLGPIIRGEKIHTIRRNHTFWRRRLARAEELSIRCWKEKPRHSPQIEIKLITPYVKNGKFGVQKICKINDGKSPGSAFSFYLVEVHEPQTRLDLSLLAKNDELTLQKFIDWFKDYPEGDMALIHFTNFRYGGEI
jgi:hypothetical protein